MVDLTEAELSNLIIACNTSRLRDGSPAWQEALDAIRLKLEGERTARDEELLNDPNWVGSRHHY